MFKEILGAAFPIIEKVAPLLASLLGSPYAGIGASMALSTIGKRFGLDENEIGKIQTTILSDPDKENKLIEVENFMSGLFKHVPLPTSFKFNLEVNWANEKINL